MWILVAAVALCFTAFLAACGLVPMRIIFIATSAVLLANQTLPWR
jgi:hypothetical protein